MGVGDPTARPPDKIELQYYSISREFVVPVSNYLEIINHIKSRINNCYWALFRAVINKASHPNYHSAQAQNMAIPLKAVTEKSISTPEDVRIEMRPQPSTSSKEAALQFDLSVAPLLPLLEAIKSSQDQIFLDEESKASLRRKLEIFLSLDHGMRVAAFLRSACWVSLCAAHQIFCFCCRPSRIAMKAGLPYRSWHFPYFCFLRRLLGFSTAGHVSGAMRRRAVSMNWDFASTPRAASSRIAHIHRLLSLYPPLRIHPI